MQLRQDIELHLCKAGYYGNSGQKVGQEEVRQSARPSPPLHCADLVMSPISPSCHKDLWCWVTASWERREHAMVCDLTTGSKISIEIHHPLTPIHLLCFPHLSEHSSGFRLLAQWDDPDIFLQGLLRPWLYKWPLYSHHWVLPQGTPWVPDTLLPASHWSPAAQLLVVMRTSYPCTHHNSSFFSCLSTGMNNLK